MFKAAVNGYLAIAFESHLESQSLCIGQLGNKEPSCRSVDEATKAIGQYVI